MYPGLHLLVSFNLCLSEGMNSSLDPVSHDITMSGEILSDLENVLPSPEAYELGVPTEEVQSFPEYLSLPQPEYLGMPQTEYLGMPQPDIFCGVISAPLLPPIPEETHTVPCLQEPDLLHPCSLHEEGVGGKEAVVAGDMLHMLDKLDLCGETLLGFGGLDPPVGPDDFCVLGAECTASLLSSCGPAAADISLEHNQPLFDQATPLGFSDELCEFHEGTKLWAIEGPSMGFLPPSLSPSSSCCGQTVNQSPGLSGESIITEASSRGNIMPVRSVVAWVTPADQQS